MAFKASITFKSNKSAVQKELERFVDRATKKSARVMERNIKVETPVKTGMLRRSIASRDVAWGKSEVYSGAVVGGAQVDYAVHVEYGTRYQAPRAMFRKGVANSEPRIKEIFRDEAKKVKVKFTSAVE